MAEKGKKNCCSFFSQWEAGLSQSFKEIVGKVVEDYCQEENCYHSSVNKR